MDFKTLENGQQYLFHIKQEHGYKKPFRANLVDVIYRYKGTILFTKVQFANIQDDIQNLTHSKLVSMPLAWIENIETLEKILEEEKDTTNKTLTLVPSDILLEIGGFL
jgi:hypothetical protein